MRELPEKWCLKITRENVDFLNSKRFRPTTCIGYYITSNLVSTEIINSWRSETKPNYFEEISTEEFKRLVLKEDTYEIY